MSADSNVEGVVPEILPEDKNSPIYTLRIELERQSAAEMFEEPGKAAWRKLRTVLKDHQFKRLDRAGSRNKHREYVHTDLVFWVSRRTFYLVDADQPSHFSDEICRLHKKDFHEDKRRIIYDADSGDAVRKEVRCMVLPTPGLDSYPDLFLVQFGRGVYIPETLPSGAIEEQARYEVSLALGEADIKEWTSCQENQYPIYDEKSHRVRRVDIPACLWNKQNICLITTGFSPMISPINWTDKGPGKKISRAQKSLTDLMIPGESLEIDLTKMSWILHGDGAGEYVGDVADSHNIGGSQVLEIPIRGQLLQVRLQKPEKEQLPVATADVASHAKPDMSREAEVEVTPQVEPTSPVGSVSPSQRQAKDEFHTGASGHSGGDATVVYEPSENQPIGVSEPRLIFIGFTTPRLDTDVYQNLIPIEGRASKVVLSGWEIKVPGQAPADAVEVKASTGEELIIRSDRGVEKKITSREIPVNESDLHVESAPEFIKFRSEYLVSRVGSLPIQLVGVGDLEKLRKSSKVFGRSQQEDGESAIGFSALPWSSSLIWSPVDQRGAASVKMGSLLNLGFSREHLKVSMGRDHPEIELAGAEKSLVAIQRTKDMVNEIYLLGRDRGLFSEKFPLVQSLELAEGDRIFIGQCVIEYRREQARPTRAANENDTMMP